MFGGASSLFMEMTNEGLFQSTTPSWASELDPMFKDKDGAWYGTIKTPVMMFYNTSMLSKDKAPKDWSDLTKPEYKNLIVSRDTAVSYTHLDVYKRQCHSYKSSLPFST